MCVCVFDSEKVGRVRESGEGVCEGEREWEGCVLGTQRGKKKR